MAHRFSPILERQVTFADFTKGQRRIMEHLIVGKTNREIAKDLQMNLSTVKYHLNGIFRKTQSKNRNQCILKISHLYQKPKTQYLHSILIF